ncbi:MAG TPA: polysaccharide deacetylase family protein [Solirubrobacteraceae bacterium]|jgi:peptidoglycan/xylan/chitin deacetylase (PgdA/CDA1 family)
MRKVGAAVALVALVALVAASGAGASVRHHRPHGHPLRVKSSSMTQNAQQITWSVEMTSSFSPGGLAKDGRALCLLRERVAGGSVAGSLCIYGPKPGERSPRLFYSRVTASGLSPGRRITATIGRSSSRTLSATFLPDEIGTQYVPIRWQVNSTLKASACANAKPHQSRCFALFPSKPALFKMHVPQVVGCVASGSSLIYSGPSSQRQLALTFDDGPWNAPPMSDWVNYFASQHVPVTFFEIGDQISEFDPTGSVERQALADGDMIGDHTWTHPDMTRLSASEQTSQLQLTADAIKRATGFSTCFWRPPYGSVNSQVVALARSLGLITVQWDVDTVDWSLPGTGTIYQRAVGGAHNGAIILQHFGGGPRYETFAAVQQEIPKLRSEGYQFVTIPQLLGLRLIYR